MKIALATASHYPELAPDDQVLHTILKRRGIDAVPVIWDTEARWQEFDAVVVRSIWDYHLKYDRFRQWLQTLDDAAVPVHNSTAVLRHNADKRYLLDLHER